MMDEQLPMHGTQSFEELKQCNEYGAEYWSARDLQPMLGYSQWRRFEDAVKRAMTSCETSGNNPRHHFAGAGKMIEVGKGGQREVEDYRLSRFACYLIAQNGDPHKPEIAQAQQYFAIQTRRQELSNQLTADMERLELRKQTSVVRQTDCILLSLRAPLKMPSSPRRRGTRCLIRLDSRLRGNDEMWIFRGALKLNYL